MTELHQLPARTVAAQLKSGDITAHDALDALEARLKVTDKVVNALPTLCFDRAHEQAERAARLPVARRGLLCGLPVGVQLIGGVGGEYNLFRHARMLEKIIGRSCAPVELKQAAQN